MQACIVAVAANRKSMSADRMGNNWGNVAPTVQLRRLVNGATNCCGDRVEPLLYIVAP